MAENIIETYERTTLEMVKDRIEKGIQALKKEKPYNDFRPNMDAIMGDQPPKKMTSLSTCTDNKIKKIVLETASALTDVRPIWNYETYRDEYKAQGIILNKLARGWWRNSRAERKFVSSIIYSCAGGAGYITVTWDGNDIVLTPYDTQDVIPIGPVFSDSIQEWEGVAVRQKVSIEALRDRYPTKAGKLQNTRNSWFGPAGGKGGKMLDIMTNMFSWGGVGGRDAGMKSSVEGVDYIRVWLKDYSVHIGDAPRVMGDPTKGTSYTVFPVGSIHPATGQVVTREDARLYPRGRLIILTPECVLEDIPNPYWHGMFPVVRIVLDPIPGTLLGTAMVTDLMPLQNGLNETLRGIEDGIQQWIKRGVVADKNALSPANLKNIDTRRPGLQALLNPTAGEGFKVIDGPQLPGLFSEMLQFYKEEMEENSGVRGLQQLTQLKQMPSADTVEKFLDALSPLLRLRAHGIEQSLSELAEMLKINFFQYYTAPKRFQILGQQGLALEDFDFDPETLIPNEPEDAPRELRAQVHHKNFTFSIAPDSLLNVSHAMQKMLILQLLRSNSVDPWTVWQAMNLTEAGPIPAETIPERIYEARRVGLMPGLPPELVKAQTALGLLQAQMAIGQAAMGMSGPMAPPPGEGGGFSTSGVGPQGGRPPSGQENPALVQKTGPEGTRTVVSESGQ